LIVLVFLFFLAFALLATIKPASQTTVAFAINLWRFLQDFAVDMIVSNFRMAHDVLTPTDYHSVCMVEVPVGDLTKAEIAFLAQRITLTPGTLCCGLNVNEDALLVHTMYPVEGKDMGRELRRPIDILKGNC